MQLQTTCTLIEPTLLSVHKVCIQSMQKVCICRLNAYYICWSQSVHKVCMMQTLQTLCRLSAELATKSLFEPFWRARRSYSMRSNEPKLCKPRELARNHQVLKGRSHSRPQTRAMAPQKWRSRKIPLFDPFLSARRSDTMRPNEPKLFNPRDLAR